MNTLSIVTTCKSRLHHLQQTLPLMCASAADEVIVVDYGCPDQTAKWVRENHPTVRVIEVQDDPGFHHARARNIGLSAAIGDWVAFIDADVRLEEGWSHWWATARLTSRACYRRDHKGRSDRGTWGSCVCPRSDAQQVGGYDEVLRGWGGEDDDFFYRLDAVGCTSVYFPAHLASSIEHPDIERTRHASIADKVSSFMISRYYRTAKYQAMAFFRRKGELPLTIRQQIDRRIRQAFSPFLDGTQEHPPTVTMTLSDQEGMTDRWSLTKQCVITLGAKPVQAEYKAHEGVTESASGSGAAT